MKDRKMNSNQRICRGKRPGTGFMEFLIIPMLVIVMTVILLSVKIFGAANDVQKDKIRQDIEILESVLDQLIIQDSPYLFSGSDQVKGIYLDGFGVMFDFESSGLLSLTDMISRSIRAIPRISFSSDDDHQITINVDKEKKPDKGDIDEKAEIEKSLKKTENLIYDFYLDYASTVKSLSDDDRICINIRNSEGFLVGQIDDLQVPSQLRACSKVSDLSDYRRGKKSESKMRSQIQIERIYNKDQNRDLDILENIFDRSLGRSTGTRLIDWDGNTRSMYLDGFGAIFFSPVSALDRFEHIIIKRAGDLEKKMVQSEEKAHRMQEKMLQSEARARAVEEQLRAREDAVIKSKRNSRQAVSAPPAAPAEPAPLALPQRVILHADDDTTEIYSDFDFDFDFDFDNATEPTEKEVDSILTCITDKIIDVLGQYGPTLHSVHKDESILVAIDIANHLWDNDWNMLYLKVKKSDVERFSHDEISPEKFKKLVKIWRD